MTSKIELDFDEFRALSPQAQDEILKALMRKAVGGAVAASSPPSAPDAPGHSDWTDLSLNEARRLVRNLGPQSKDFLKIIVENGGRAKASILVKGLSLKRWQDLRGIQSGITKRTRTVTGNKSAYLIHWDQSTYEYDKNEEFSDAVIALSDVTCESLSKAL